MKLKKDLEEIVRLEKEHNVLGVSICTAQGLNISTEDAIPLIKELITNSGKLIQKMKDGKIKRLE